MTNSALPRGAEADRCRAHTRARLPAFVASLRESMPSLVITVDYPFDDAGMLAATVWVCVRHTKSTRAVDCAVRNVPVNAVLTDDEKRAIGAAVGKAASDAGLEAWLKPRWCDKHQLVYRVFWKA